MGRLARTCVLLAALGLLAAAPGASGQPAASAPGAHGSDAGPQADASRRCGIRGQQRRLGPTYVLSLSARGVGCRRAKEIVRAYHSCRFRNGGRRGRCPRVSGYRCRESRSGIPSQFDARATCRRGGKVVSHRYTQNT